MADLRSAVARQMVRFHDIPLSLAEEHVAGMDEPEIRQRKRHYIKLGAAEKRQINKPCSICLHVRWLVCDHDHATGEFRGEICNACNSWLGFLEKYPENYYTRKGRKEWRRWVYENAGRIREHLERRTGLTYGEALRIRSQGAELSAASPTPKSASDFYQVFGVATTTAGLRPSAPLPELLSPMPESEENNLVRRPGLVLPRLDSATLPESEIKNLGIAGSESALGGGVPLTLVSLLDTSA